MSDWKVGDVVKLKSGGPAMTVSELRGDKTVKCIWFAGIADLMDDYFPIEAIKKCKKKKATK